MYICWYLYNLHTFSTNNQLLIIRIRIITAAILLGLSINNHQFFYFFILFYYLTHTVCFK